jgi:predicted ATPase
MDRIVFTGPPSSGKTTTLNELGIEGKRILPDTARIVVNLIKEIGISVEVNKAIISELMTLLQLLFESSIDTDIVYLDMALPDSIVYRCLKGEANVRRDVVQGLSYDIVFLFEPLNFVDDGIRELSQSYSRKDIFEKMFEVYQEFTDNLIIVPVGSLEKRVCFIKKKINELNKNEGRGIYE